MKAIKSRTIKDGTFMKAPNGKPTNLTERQWLQARTKNFKNWFGDWENDPENASKVVNPETGEPMVVYHATDADFTTFSYDNFGKTDSGTVGKGFYFSANKDYIKHYGNKVMAVFLNIKEPVDLRGKGYSRTDIQAYIHNDDKIFWAQTNIGQKRPSDGVIVDQLESIGLNSKTYDSVEYVSFDPNQIKSATDNVGTFSTENDDIRFAIDTDYVDLYDDEREDAYTYLEDEHAGRAIVRGDVGLYLIDHPGKGSIRRDKNGVPQGFQCKIKIDTRNLSEEQIREFENNIENGRIKDQRSADLWVEANIDQQRHDISNSIDIEVRGSNEDHDSLDLGSQAREPIRGLRDSDSQENSGESRLIKTGGDGTNFPRVIEVENQRFITPQGQVYGYATPEGAIYLDERVIKKSRTCVRDFFIKACPLGQPDCLL